MTIKIVADMFIGISEISLHSTRSLDDEKITVASSEFSDYDYDDCSFSSTDYNDENDDGDNWDVSACVGEDSVMLAKNRGIRQTQYKTCGNRTATTELSSSSPSSPATKDQSTSSTDQTTSKPTEASPIVYSEFVVDAEDGDLHEAFDCNEQDSVKLASRRNRGGRVTSNSSHSKEQRPRKNYSALIDEIGDDVDYEDELVFPLNDEL